MAKFLFVYRGTPGAESKMPPDQMQQVMQKWGAWIGEAMQKGWMINPGDALTEKDAWSAGKSSPTGLLSKPKKSSAVIQSSRPKRSKKQPNWPRDVRPYSTADRWKCATWPDLRHSSERVFALFIFIQHDSRRTTRSRPTISPANLRKG